MLYNYFRLRESRYTVNVAIEYRGNADETSPRYGVPSVSLQADNELADARSNGGRIESGGIWRSAAMTRRVRHEMKCRPL